MIDARTSSERANALPGRQRNARSGGLPHQTLIVLIAWGASTYFLLLPLLRARGVYGWGHYRIVDLALGLPAIAIGVCAVVGRLVPTRSRRALGIRVAALLLPALLCVGLIEAACLAEALVAKRHAPPIGDPWRDTLFWMESRAVPRSGNCPDPELGWRHQANFQVRVGKDSQGLENVFRTDERGYRNPPGRIETEIAILGDSMTEGGDVHEEATYVRRLETLSGKTTLNFAVSCYGPRQEAIVLERDVLPLRPKVVIWQFYEGNDLDDMTTYRKWLNLKASGALQHRYSLLAVHTMFSRSPLMWLLKATEAPVRDPRRVVRLQRSDGRKIPVTMPYRYDPTVCQRLDREWAEARSTIEAAQHLCRERGVKFLVLYLPTSVRVLKDQLEWDLAEAAEEYCPGGMADAPGDLAHRMAEFCETIGCPLVDATPVLRELARVRPESVFVKDGSHLDIAGHERVAVLLAEDLAKRE